MKRETYNEIKELTGQIDLNLEEQDQLGAGDVRYWQLQRRNRELLRTAKALVLGL